MVDIDLGVHYCLSDYVLYMFATFHESSGEKPVLISSVHIMCNLVSVSCSCSHSQRTPVIMLYSTLLVSSVTIVCQIIKPKKKLIEKGIILQLNNQ